MCAKNEVALAYYGIRSHFSTSSKKLNSYERDCISEITEKSAFVIENYWSREKAFRIRDQLAEYHDSKMPFVLGDSHIDELVRIYHVERLIPELKEFRFDPFVLNIAQGYNGFPSYSGALVYQHDTVYGREKSHYHVDTFLRQFKAMMYLDDVDEGNGPFSFIPGSHKERKFFIKKQLRGNKNNKNNVFDEVEINAILHKEKSVCVPAGSLLMMDVGCIHRGAPQTQRSRSVLMNYIVPNNKDIYLQKELPPLKSV